MDARIVSVSLWHERRVSRLAEDFVIEMLHITKEFPGIKANDDITLQLRVNNGQIEDAGFIGRGGGPPPAGSRAAERGVQT